MSRACPRKSTTSTSNIGAQGSALEMAMSVSLMAQSSSIGMQTYEMALKALYEAGVVALEDALSTCSDPDEFLRLLGPHSHRR